MPRRHSPCPQSLSRCVDRFTRAIVVGVLVLVVGGVGTAAFLQSREQAPDLSSPAGVTIAYAQAVGRGDGERAWSLLSAAAQGQSSRERFLLRVAGMRSGNGRVRLATESERVEADVAHLDLVRTYPQSGGIALFGDSAPQRSSVTLVREGGQWRILVPPDPFVLQP